MHTFVSSKRIRALRRIHIEQILKSSSGSVYPCSGKITGSEIHFSALILFYVCLSFSLFDYLSLFVCFSISRFLSFCVSLFVVCLFVCLYAVRLILCFLHEQKDIQMKKTTLFVDTIITIMRDGPQILDHLE